MTREEAIGKVEKAVIEAKHFGVKPLFIIRYHDLYRPLKTSQSAIKHINYRFWNGLCSIKFQADNGKEYRTARGAAQSNRLSKICTCREPKRHRACQYCGSGYWGEVVCGVCHEAGIDGHVIRGTERRVCKSHK